MAGSAFGFSDEFMGEQRAALATQNREFERDQTKRAFTELRMEHLRTTHLQQFNDESRLLGHGQVDSLDEGTLTAIQHQVEEEVATRMSLLRAQTDRALSRLNEARTERHEEALREVPDESYDTAFHQLFDHPEVETLPTDDELLTALTRAPATGGGPGAHPGGGTAPTPHPGGAPGTPPGGAGSPAGAGASQLTGAGASTTAAGAHTPGGGAPTGHGTGTGQGTGAAHADEPWRTADTMRGRFEGLGNALLGDVAHAELGFFGSVLGFDEQFERGLHQQITPAHTAAGTTPGAHPDAAHPDAAHPDAAHPDAAHGGAAHPDAAHAAGAHAAGAHTSTAALQTVEGIVGDPYSLDELANRLYPNIRTRLRQELLIDRERAGLLADFR
jgi:hypothetical protein